MAGLQTAVVLDTTVVAAYVFREPARALAATICLDVSLNAIAAFVPDLLWAELQNVCARKRDRDGLSSVDIEAAYGLAQALPLNVQDNCLTRYSAIAWNLVRRIPRVGSYAMYFLSLALDLQIPLWTLDQAFRNEVHAEGTYAATVRLVGVDGTV